VELQLGLPGEGDEGVFGEGMVYISRIIRTRWRRCRRWGFDGTSPFAPNV
jgi:hypothetical protein